MSPTTPERFWAKVNKTEGGCWLWTGWTNIKGYGSISYQGTQWTTHRLAYHLTHGSIPSGLFVCHTCDVPSCCNPDHLWLGTNHDNVLDMFAKGRALRRGADNGFSKLTEEKVRQIWHIYHSGGYSQPQVAEMFGVKRTTVQSIISGKNWGHVTKALRTAA